MIVRGVPESDLKKRIKDWLSSEGDYWCDPRGGAYSRPGTPDIVACINGRFLGIEAKTGNGKQRHDQVLAQNLIEGSKGVYVLAYDLGDVVRAVEGLE